MAKHLTRKNKSTRRKYNYRKSNYKRGGEGFWNTFKRTVGRNIPRQLCPPNYVYDAAKYGCIRRHQYENKIQQEVIPAEGVGVSVPFPDSYPKNSDNDSDYK